MIKFDNVSFVYPDKDIYDNISFEIEKSYLITLGGMLGV